MCHRVPPHFNWSLLHSLERNNETNETLELHAVHRTRTTLCLPHNEIDADNAVRLLAILAAVDKCSLGQNPHIAAILGQEAVYSGLTLSF